MFQTKLAEKINTHFVFSLFFESCAVYEIMWKNILEPGRPQMTIWCMRIACCVRKATDTHSECVILISFHCRNVRTNAPHHYVIWKLPVFLPLMWRYSDGECSEVTFV